MIIRNLQEEELNNQELIHCFSDIAREKNIDRTELGTILEDLFLTLLEKQFGDASNCSVLVNIDKGEIEIYQEKTIVEEVDDPATQIDLEKACEVEPDLTVGDPFIEVIDPIVFGRRLIMTARQFLSQRIKDIERQYIFEDYFARVGEIIVGEVRQIQRDNIHLFNEQSEMRLPKKEQISSERPRRGETVRGIVKSVEMTPRGPDIVISRSDNQFLAKLFEMEVPEIEDSIIVISSIARAPGERSKLIVKSTDRRIDAVGACVGMRGSRIQAVVRELNGEKIDVINYSSQSEILISRALSPAKPINLRIDDEQKYCVAVFDDEDMESGVGKSYLNVTLASEVTGYTIEAERRVSSEGSAIKLSDVKALTTRMVSLLDEAEIITIKDFQDANQDKLLEVKGIGEKFINSVTDKINNFLESLSKDESIEENVNTVVDDTLSNDEEDISVKEVTEEVEAEI
jgi:N utilization substance protein A|tara:strand:+ start:1317 stop:2690 length:1374 start_codon:yes stop_codon:yes gene_type:complete